jgi:hypothetical protein
MYFFAPEEAELGDIPLEKNNSCPFSQSTGVILYVNKLVLVKRP